MEPRRVNIDKFGLKEDKRKKEMRFDNQFSDSKKNLYDTLVNMVVNHKMELQKIPACSHLNTATVWAEKRGLRAGEEDFDKDGHPETVVYNKSGQPFIINGYKLKHSDYPARRAYWGTHPSTEDRAGEPMREWITEKAYNEEIDAERPWKRTINTTPFGSKLKEWGYKMPTKPKKQLSVFSHFCKLIAPYVKTYFENGALTQLLGDNATPNCATILKKIISPITMYRMLYMKVVERWYFFHLRADASMEMSYEQFKQYCKSNPNKLWTFYIENILDPNNFYAFKENIINDEVVARLFVKEGLNWDFEDKDDAIVFFMGKENVDDDEFTDIIQNEGDAADEFINSLTYGDKATKRKATKLIEKWKVRARKGTKDFFENQIKYLMENGDAFERFNQAVSEGKNPIDPDPSAGLAASPVKSVETRTTPEIAPDDAIPPVPPAEEEVL